MTLLDDAPVGCAANREDRGQDPLAAADEFLAELAGLSVRDPRRQRLRESLIIRGLPVARREAQRFYGGVEPFEDLLQVAVLGLILAIDRYDARKGVPFRHFAGPTIVGELKHHFRDRTWSVRVSRREQQLSLLIRGWEPQLAQRLGRLPSTRDIATELGLTHRDVVEGQVASAARAAVSLDTPLFADGKPKDLRDTLGGPDAALESFAEHDALRRALAALPGHLLELLRLRFVDELSQQQIADRRGISQMQVSRLIARSLGLLRTHMLGEPPAVRAQRR